MPKMITRLLILLVGASTVLLLAGFANQTNSVNDLPPRPEATAVPAAAVTESLNGENIQLKIDNEEADIPANLWTVVEWQDPYTEEWYKVTGWQGTLDAPSSQTWWTGSDMFGDGPFRWLVYAYEDGELLVTSESFYLPTAVGQPIEITVTLP